MSDKGMMMRVLRYVTAFVVALTIVAAIARVGPVDAQDGAEATISALQTRVAELEATVEARGDKINAQRTQIAEFQSGSSNPTAEATTRPERGERCEDVHANAIAWIVGGLNADLSITLRGVQAVRSTDFEKVWFVAADIEGPGFEGVGQIAVWTMTEIDETVGVSDGSGTMTVNDVAVSVNGYWFHGPDTDAEISMEDDGVQESIDCTKQVIGG